jgi:hypothetical protein
MLVRKLTAEELTFLTIQAMRTSALVNACLGFTARVLLHKCLECLLVSELKQWLWKHLSFLPLR